MNGKFSLKLYCCDRVHCEYEWQHGQHQREQHWWWCAPNILLALKIFDKRLNIEELEYKINQ